MRSGTVDERVLREFRDAVDHVREDGLGRKNGSSAVQHTDPQSVISLVVANAFAGHPTCDSITADVAAQQVNRTTVGIEEF